VQSIDSSGLIYFQFEQWLNSQTLVHAVFSRHGGVSRAPWASLNFGGTVGDSPEAVRRNHQRSFEALELDYAQACTVWQVHSADTVMVERPAQGRKWLARADGMITNVPGLPLTMRFADCVPILLYDPVQRAVGIVHAGWRGTVGRTVSGAVQAMAAAYGSRPTDLEAAIGPSIGPDHFQVGQEVVDAVRDTFGTTDGLMRRAADGTAYVDLWEANRRLLEREGVRKVEVANLCTYAHVTDFYSHRAERGKTGRFGAVIALREGDRGAA
jgi:YfiH family protein